MRRIWRKIIDWLISDEDVISDYCRNYSKYMKKHR